MADGIVTSDQIGAGDNKTYGADIGPSGGQDMWQFDPLVGFPQDDRTTSAATFTGGDGGVGLGGTAEPMSPGGGTPPNAQPGTVYERRGF